MQRRRLGRSGLEISLLGLGCNNLGWRCDEGESANIVAAALDCGINFFDTADVYGRHGDSEIILGRALANRRREVLIATKFGAPMSRDGTMEGANPAYIALALAASLRRLGTDYIDLYQLHWPAGFSEVGSIIAGATTAEQVVANAEALARGLTVYCPA